MKEIIKKYLNGEIKYSKEDIIGLICLVIVLSGIFGFVYELIFYYFNSGMKYFEWQGGNFLPWINIYAIGSILILIFSYKHKKKPLKVFFTGFITSGILEYISGFLILKILGTRFWDYNSEIWNFGNINGYICLRSVTFFGLSSLLLIYIIVPFCIFLSKKINKKKFMTISVIFCTIFLIDEIYNLIANYTNLISANELYKSIGFKR